MLPDEHSIIMERHSVIVLGQSCILHDKIAACAILLQNNPVAV